MVWHAKCKTTVYVLTEICLQWSKWLGPKTLDDEKSTLDDLEQEDSRQDDFNDDMEFDPDAPADDAPNDQGLFHFSQ